MSVEPNCYHIHYKNNITNNKSEKINDTYQRMTFPIAWVTCNVVLKCFISNKLLLIMNSRCLFFTKESQILQAQCTHFRHTHRTSWLFHSFSIQWIIVFYWKKGPDIWLTIIYSLIGGVTSINETVVLFFYLHMW